MLPSRSTWDANRIWHVYWVGCWHWCKMSINIVDGVQVSWAACVRRTSTTVVLDHVRQALSAWTGSTTSTAAVLLKPSARLAVRWWWRLLVFLSRMRGFWGNLWQIISPTAVFFLYFIFFFLFFKEKYSLHTPVPHFKAKEQSTVAQAAEINDVDESSLVGCAWVRFPDWFPRITEFRSPPPPLFPSPALQFFLFTYFFPYPLAAMIYKY